MTNWWRRGCTATTKRSWRFFCSGWLWVGKRWVKVMRGKSRSFDINNLWCFGYVTPTRPSCTRWSPRGFIRCWIKMVWHRYFRFITISSSGECRTNRKSIWVCLKNTQEQHLVLVFGSLNRSIKRFEIKFSFYLLIRQRQQSNSLLITISYTPPFLVVLTSCLTRKKRWLRVEISSS
jgi:hypothetical protein